MKDWILERHNIDGLILRCWLVIKREINNEVIVELLAFQTEHLHAELAFDNSAYL